MANVCEVARPGNVNVFAQAHTRGCAALPISTDYMTNIGKATHEQIYTSDCDAPFELSADTYCKHMWLVMDFGTDHVGGGERSLQENGWSEKKREFDNTNLFG